MVASISADWSACSSRRYHSFTRGFSIQKESNVVARAGADGGQFDFAGLHAGQQRVHIGRKTGETDFAIRTEFFPGLKKFGRVLVPRRCERVIALAAENQNRRARRRHGKLA